MLLKLTVCTYNNHLNSTLGLLKINECYFSQQIDLKKQSQSEALIVSEKFTNESKQQIRLLQFENTDLKEKYKQLQDKLDLQNVC